MSELTAMQRAVLVLLGDLVDRTGSVVAERLIGEIRDGYPIKGESAPQTAGESPEGASDTRGKLEADILNAGHDNSTEEIFGWLDRQAAITRREQEGVIAVLQAEANALEAENDELAHERSDAEMERDELSQRAQQLEAELADALRAICKRFDVDTNMSAEDAAKNVLEALERDWMRLPVDADGVPIRPGDRVCGYGRKEDGMTVRFLDQHGNLMVGDTGTTNLRNCLYWTAENVTHVQPDTVESLLCDMIHEYGSTDALTETVAEKYAERIRKAVKR